MAREVRKPEITHVTITGRVIPLNNDSYMELVLLAYRFRRTLIKAIKMTTKGLGKNTIVKEVTKELNLGYADTIYKLAKLIVEGAKSNGSNPLRVKLRRLFIASGGFTANKGNRNIRLLSSSELQVNIPWKGWVKFKVVSGKRCIPLVNELVEKALSKKLSYTAKIVFRNGKVYLHISIPIELYLKYFSKGRAKGKLIAGFDLNSDRVNMVVVNRQGIIRGTKTEWFPEVTSHGFPRNKANTIRLQALAKLLDYAYHHGVGVALFEDLDRIKKRRYTRSKTANRKIT
ncbi:MAG: transposase [Thermoprotei archaeon]|nr:MAG: transposase [Thermoprotei archaeon]